MTFTNKHISQSLLIVAFALVSAISVFAQAIPDNAPISDQKPGSVLIFNYYVSKSTDISFENTRMGITNTNAQQAGQMSLFFIDTDSGKVMSSYICLAPNRAVSWLISDVDPDVKGYMIAVSVDATGRPNKFNYFTGSESVKTASGYRADLNAEAISALVESPTVFDGLNNGVAAWLKFDDVRYNKVPGALVLDYIPSIADGNKTMVIVNQIGGSLLNGGKPEDLGPMTGTVYDMATKAYFWQTAVNNCQLRKVIANDFPQTGPNMSAAIPAGTYGWMKFWPHTPNKGMTGAVLYLNPNTSSNVSRFTGGRNLNHLRLTADELTIPIIIPQC